MSRESIYYWKCDRPSAFQPKPERNHARIASALEESLRETLSDPSVELQPFDAPGNHLAWKFSHADGERTSFVRVEDGPEQDDYLKVESHLLGVARAVGVPTPELVAVDASREHVPFVWQAIEWVEVPSLDHWHRQGVLQAETVLHQLGQFLARLQDATVTGFGPFSTDALKEKGTLQGYHSDYRDYFFLNLDRHLDGLSRGGLFEESFKERIMRVIDECQDLLHGFDPTLVHKDTALWNLLGHPDRITAMIDWDDAIGGDPVDDLSLIGCFFSRDLVDRAIAGYAEAKPLPEAFEARYALHLLRNLIFKALIRLRGGIFEATGDSFLLPPGKTGEALRSETIERMRIALNQLEGAIH